MAAKGPADYKGKGNETDIKNLQEAERLKQEGNHHFRSKAWEEALAQYKSALGHLPGRIREPPREPVEPREPSDPEAAEVPTPETLPATPPQPRNEESPEIVKARAVLNANVGACYVQLGEHEKVVEACTEALADDPHYIKALQRRAASNENIASWSALTSAQEDYRTLLDLFPESSTQRSEVNRMLRNLEPRMENQRKKETGEMMGKLKELGNTFLGNFGLSTDNFKFEPNGQGGYSVNFSR